MKNVMITQSNYIPWKGYFDSIRQCDLFVVYDDMQYTRRDWRNRNLIKTPQGLKWLTIPVEVKGKYLQKIKDTRVVDKDWTTDHWNILKESYRKAPCFSETAEWAESLYRTCQYDYLTDINMHFIHSINEWLGVKTDIMYSSSFELHEERTMRLVNICKETGATDYYSGPAAKAYMNESFFEEAGIRVHYWDYTGYPEYPQLYPPFTHGVSIFDLIFNTGLQCHKYLKP